MKRRRFALDVRPGAVALLAGLYFLLPLRWPALPPARGCFASCAGLAARRERI